MQQKRIAIMTWYQYRNYGTALQASALYQTLRDLGYAADLIQYQPRKFATKETVSGFVRKTVDAIGYGRSKTYQSDERERLFTEYLDARVTQTALIRTYPELAELNGLFDAFVCGSDQIWSPLNYDENYFLPFVKDRKKRIAYGPSMGSANTNDTVLAEKIAQHIGQFSHLSVREQQGADWIGQLTGKTAEVVLDPTLLMNGEQWNTYAAADREVQIPKQPYMICYFLGNEQKYMRYVHKLSGLLQMPFYIIPVTVKQKNMANALPFEVGPSEFLSLIRNAQYVCTDSFHGVSFAINYNIPFTAFKRFADSDLKNQNARILHLLKILKLENRLADHKHGKLSRQLLQCDFLHANQLLEKHRSASLAYLKAALAEAVMSNKKTEKTYTVTDLCCGCGACAAVCPKSAITVLENEDGFQHYCLDAALCIGCGKCKAVCPMQKITAPDMKKAEALYAAHSHSEQALENSSSGGIAHEIARICQQEGQYVFGCAYDRESNRAMHIALAPNQPEKLWMLQGSKYIQSISTEAFDRLKSLEKDTAVVFFGTPCQVAAADKLLTGSGMREQALLVDLICKGVPTRYLWEKYLEQIAEQYDTGKHPAVTFRKGWHPRKIQVSGNGRVYVKGEGQDDFYGFFLRNLCNMPACYECPYRERSAADLRLGDFWGSQFADCKHGVSMVIANTEKGALALKRLDSRGCCKVQQQNLEAYWKIQHPYNRTAPVVRDRLIQQLKQKDRTLHQLRKKYCGYYDRKEKLSGIYQKLKQLLS